MGRIFISYRRGETSAAARALFNEIAAALGKDALFMDAGSDALAVLIGNDWLDGKDASAPSPLHNPADYVRREIEAALARNISITPVLLNGAQMPRPDQLPDAIREFSYGEGFELSPTRWAADVRLLRKRLGLADQDEPKAVSDEDAAVSDEAVAVSDEDAAVSDEDVAVSKESLSVSNEFLSVSNETVAVGEEAVAVCDETVAVSEEAVATPAMPIDIAPPPLRPVAAQARTGVPRNNRRRLVLAGGVALAMMVAGASFGYFRPTAEDVQPVLKMALSVRPVIKKNSSITLRSADKRYVVNARSGEGYYYARLGGAAQVMVLEAGDEALVGGSAVRIRTTEKWRGEWAGKTYLGAFGDKAELYYWDYYGAKTRWIIEKVTGKPGEPIYSGDKVYIQNERFTGQYLTTHPKNYLTTTNRTPHAEWTIALP